MASKNKIDIVAHSFGFAYSLGMVDYLIDKIQADAGTPKFGRYYILAPENAVGKTGSIEPSYRLKVNNFESVFQYGSNFENKPNGEPFEKYCYRDGIAPQIAINATQAVPNVFIPTTDKYKWMREFNKAHSSDNYGWIFTEDDSKFTVVKRNP
jgi:hypothetical protein